LTGFSRLPARHDPRGGQGDRKRVVTMSGGSENPAFGGPDWSIVVVAKACPMPGIALRFAPSRVGKSDSIK